MAIQLRAHPNPIGINDMETQYNIIYPVNRAVPASEILQRAMDYWLDGDLEERPEDGEHAADLLQEAGLITLAGS